MLPLFDLTGVVQAKRTRRKITTRPVWASTPQRLRPRLRPPPWEWFDAVLSPARGADEYSQQLHLIASPHASLHPRCQRYLPSPHPPTSPSSSSRLVEMPFLLPSITRCFPIPPYPPLAAPAPAARAQPAESPHPRTAAGDAPAVNVPACEVARSSHGDVTREGGAGALACAWADSR
jgi:hypothetical protein